jgi:hypothetical protein
VDFGPFARLITSAKFRLIEGRDDEGRGVWKDRPRHDEASHGADAFFTFAFTPALDTSGY